MLDEQKIQQFIQRGNDLGKSEQEIKTAYNKAMQDGVFNAPLVNQSYSKPNALQELQKPKKRKKVLFSDEQYINQSIIDKGYDVNVANTVIKNRRKDLLKDTKFRQGEASMMTKLAESGIPSTKAVEALNMLRDKRRKQQWESMNPIKKAGKTFFDFTVGTLSGGVGEVSGITDFLTGGKSELAKQGLEGRDYIREVAPGKATSAGGILGSGIVDYTIGRGLGKLPLGKVGNIEKVFGRLSTTGKMGLGGAGFGVLGTIGEKGNEATIGDVATGGATGLVVGAGLAKVATPIAIKTIQKGIKYGQAGIKGGVKGATKSIYRDIKRPIVSIKQKGISQEKAARISTNTNRLKKGIEEEFHKQFKQSSGEFATSRGMYEVGSRAVDKSALLYKKSYQIADKGLALIKGEFSMKGNKLDILGMMLQKLKKTAINTTARETKEITNLFNKYNSKGLTMSEINRTKRLYSQKHKYNFLETASEKSVRDRNWQDRLRVWQFKIAKNNGFSELSKINKETQAWRMYSDALEKNLSGKQTNNLMSITDFIALSGGHPGNIGLFAGKKIGAIPAVKKGIIKGLGKQTKKSIQRVNYRKIVEHNIEKQKTKAMKLFKKETGIGSKPQKLLPVGKTKNAPRTQILSSNKPIKLKIKVNRPIIKVKGTPKKSIQATKKLVVVNDNILTKLGETKVSENFYKESIGKIKGNISKWEKLSDVSSKSKLMKAKYRTLPNLEIKYRIINSTKELTSNNIDSIAKTIAKKIGANTEEVIKIIKAHINKYGKEFKNYLGSLADNIVDKV